MENIDNIEYPRTILGLDVSTACIGVCVIKDYGNDQPEIIKLNHVSPKISSKIKGFEALYQRILIFRDEFLPTLKDLGITDVVIEEPLLGSNNTNTVGTLLRFNGMISFIVRDILGVTPNFISSYDARTYSFPELVSLRKYNKRGNEYPIKHIKDAIKKDNIVLFGSYPFDIDKKTVMMNMVDEKFPDIPWAIGKNGSLIKENYDACDSLICALAYININHNGIEKPTIESHEIEENDSEIIVKYTTKIWNKLFEKKLVLSK